MPSIRALLVLLLAGLLVAGCGGSGEGEGYRVDLPEGWSDRTDEADEEDFPIRFDRLFAKDPEDGFATNVNVIDEEAEGVDVDQAAEQSLEAFGATDVTDGRDTEIDGEEAIERDYSLEQDGQQLRGRQLYVRMGRLYTVTFTAREDSFEEDLPGFEEILDSWQWE